jgi:hypothetical protein
MTGATYGMWESPQHGMGTGICQTTSNVTNIEPRAVTSSWLARVGKICIQATTVELRAMLPF